jgi:hypothetical protein
MGRPRSNCENEDYILLRAYERANWHNDVSYWHDSAVPIGLK